PAILIRTLFPYTTLFRSVQRERVRGRELTRPQTHGIQLKPAVVDHFDKPRVADRAVVALEVVLDRDLPVGADLVMRPLVEPERVDRKSTRLNSSHQIISY